MSMYPTLHTSLHSSFPPPLGQYVAIRFVVGMGTGGLGLISYVLSTECIGQTLRHAELAR